MIEAVAKLASDIRDVDRKVFSRHSFPDSGLTYWDADDFLLQVKVLKIAVKITKSEKVEKTICLSSASSADNEVSVSPYRVVDMSYASSQGVDVIVEALNLFGGTMEKAVPTHHEDSRTLLSQPGMSQMAQYCQRLDQEIVKKSSEFKKRFPKVVGLLDLLSKEMGDASRVGKRVGYYAKVVDLYRQNPAIYRSEMKRLGLVK